MKKHINILYLFASIFFIATPGFAQKCNIGNKVSSDSLMLSAISDIVFVIKQEYGLKSTKTKNEMLYSPLKSTNTDAVYGIGAISMNRLFAETYFQKPWETDKNYAKLKSDTLKPALGKLYTRSALSNEYTFFNCSVVQDSLIIPDTSKNANKNLKYYNMLEIKNFSHSMQMGRKNNFNDSCGILVVYYTDKNTDITKKPESPVSVAIYNVTVTFDPKTHISSQVNAPINGTIIGGAFLSVNAADGLIAFDLKGMLCFKDSKWVVSKLPPPLKFKQSKNPNNPTGTNPLNLQKNREQQQIGKPGQINKNTNSTDPVNK